MGSFARGWQLSDVVKALELNGLRLDRWLRSARNSVSPFQATLDRPVFRGGIRLEKEPKRIALYLLV